MRPSGARSKCTFLTLTADQLGVATASSVVVALAGRGMPIGESYAGRILSDYKAAQKSANGARTSVRRKA